MVQPQMPDYTYGDWLSCPECGSSTIHVATVFTTDRVDLSEEIGGGPIQGVGQAWLSFECCDCDFQSQNFDPEDVIPSY